MPRVAKQKRKFQNMIVQQGTKKIQKRDRRKWKSLTVAFGTKLALNGTPTIPVNWTFFKLLIRDVPMKRKGFLKAVTFLKNHGITCLILEKDTQQPYTENLCLFRLLALYFNGNEKMEKLTSKSFSLKLNQMTQFFKTFT